MNLQTLVDLAGWAGAGMLLLAYALVSGKKLTGDSMAYQVLNLVGSAVLVANSFHYGAYPSVGVNVVWIGIALFTMWRISRRRATHSGAQAEAAPISRQEVKSDGD